MCRKKRCRPRISRRASQESREAFLAAAQNKHDADAACRMCAQGQARTGQRKGVGRQQTRAASCISIINNQDLDHANHIRPPAPPAVKAHQPASDQCIFTAQAHPDTQSPLAKACNIFTPRSSQTGHCHTAVPSVLASATRNMTCPGCRLPSDLARLCHRPKLKLKLCPCWSCPTRNLTSDFPFPSLWNSRLALLLTFTTHDLQRS
jgi:hypothetical protein